ncbi:c-type cytochrome biogenesis protein CcsB [uncultured Thiothrix sp.]|jgi:cytochrome c-type biogenesis protein CcsB|uniref:c-type cytochrome biogenesis protein CcsB n=1 Tax=uncultured Thiothrix sp. TaxID=223185 RepID=UPI00262330B6|nr:c-type cytochrome biogenesis protein CcsB [uncultured Thiothrix sp.]HMT91961.1 c-type cytochrome biogenesis protein CcsB [Thiolinea sp.]
MSSYNKVTNPLSFEPNPSWLQRLNALDWLWALAIISGVGVWLYKQPMDHFELAILLGTSPALIGLGWFWKSIRVYSLVVITLSLVALFLYSGQRELAETNFFLKYLLSSQSAIMWMSTLFVMATLTYFLGLFTSNEITLKTASYLTWAALIMGLTGLMVRWYESYLIDPSFGHIPVSNLYEVFILFCILTGLLYLYYEQEYQQPSLGGFVLLVISAAVGFLLWYSFERGAHKILPLVPALQSYWMKIHVPANFIGYGSFALAAMVSIAYLIKQAASPHGSDNFFARALPSLDLMDELTYKAIALGFAFFTVATILGAMWAAEAWGGYWSWDPKETWALIVWLNYAAWLHFRFSKGWRGTAMAWWAILGLFITLFAFLGVNMFLSGLHSYGQL